MPEHQPVLLDEVLAYLNPRSGQNFVDATVGGGGHARALLSHLGPTGTLFALDYDPTAAAAARELGSNVVPLLANFREVNRAVRYVAPDLPIHGILFDLGMSSLQLGDPTLGLSFQTTGPLDMRLDRSKTKDSNMTAASIVNTWREPELVRIFRQYGEEPLSRQIVAAIVRRRRLQPFLLTTDLAEVIVGVAARFGRRRTKIHPATRTFQALRMAVNNELENLAEGLKSGLDLIVTGGRLAVISFHSLEDRVVKNTFRAWAGKQIAGVPTNGMTVGRIITKKPVRPSPNELDQNPRARSGKLRVFEKTI